MAVRCTCNITSVVPSEREASAMVHVTDGDLRSSGMCAIGVSGYSSLARASRELSLVRGSAAGRARVTRRRLM